MPHEAILNLGSGCVGDSKGTVQYGVRNWEVEPTACGLGESPLCESPGFYVGFPNFSPNFKE